MSGFKGVDPRSTTISMPTNVLTPAEDPFGPGGRLSHSSRWAHGLCPRAWFYEREWGWRGLALPVLVFGHAVEETVCRTLRECPALVSANAITEVFDSPTREHHTYWGRRDRVNTIIDQRIEAPWKGPLLIPNDDRFESIEDLRNWAYARIEVHWKRAITAAHENWINDPNKEGDWNEFMTSRGNKGPAFARAGIDMHLEEVSRCIDQNGGKYLHDFRSGKRMEISAPDGFSSEDSQPHPCAQKDGDCSIVEAWELARPWFVDPDAGTFTQQAILPEGWFQGEYDLVYRWDGGVKIVDLKASDGTSEWAASYPVQMKTYAWLWWAINERKEVVSGLETWYLGCSKIKSYEIPSVSEMEDFEGSLHAFWEKHVANKGKRNIEDYPPEPTPVPRFSEGGGEKSGEGGPEVRCNSCTWAEECEGSGRKRTHSSSSEFSDNKGETYQLQEIDSVSSRISVEGRIRSWKPNKWQFGGISPAFSLRTDSGEIWCSPYKGGPMEIDGNVGEGKLVRVVDAYLAPTRRGSPQLKIDHLTTIEIIEEEEKRGMVSPNSLQRINLRGRIMSLSYSEGETNWGKWKRWGAELSTPDGSIEISAMSENIPFCYDEVKRGDDVIVLNGFSTAFGDKKQISFDSQTKLTIL